MLDWSQLTKAQQDKLLYALAQGECDYDYDGNVWANLIKKGLAAKASFRKRGQRNIKYSLTTEGERLAKIGKDIVPKETDNQRKLRLYQEAMRGKANAS